MRFGEILLSEAEGATLAHSVKHASGLFKKGRVLSADDISTLLAASITKVFAARFGPGDIPEDAAASAIAGVAGGEGTVAQAAFTGRANLHSTVHGLALVDVERVRALNRLHESLTLATAAQHAVIEARQMVATVKIIPFAVPRQILEKALAIVGSKPLIRVAAFRHRRAGLIITRLPQSKPSLIVKSETAMRQRISELDGELGAVLVVDHAIAAVREAIADLRRQHCDPILVFGASAIVDRGDVIPAALTAAGGEVVHLGMPVDPGNLMMYGRLDDIPVIGVPSCARSPKVNGFDWVLERVMAEVPVTREDIMDMGAGGLLAEIPTRPSPREGKSTVQRAPRVVAIVLAAGQSTRMGANKMLADFHGEPLIRHTVLSVLSWSLHNTIVVTGNEAGKITAALEGLAINIVHNADYATGLSSSLRCGLKAVPEDADAVLVCLGDMPVVEAGTVRRLIASFNRDEHRTICVPVYKGRRGNPVLWGRMHLAAMAALTGDQGARPLIEQFADEVIEIETPDEGVVMDADTPEALAALRARTAP